jgi:hypothetical protein
LDDTQSDSQRIQNCVGTVLVIYGKRGVNMLELVAREMICFQGFP